MTLLLTHVQRLNLIALMGAQRANVAEMRMFWDLQDRIGLDDEEKEAIGYRVATQGEIEVPSWNREKTIPLAEVSVSDAEAQRLKRMIEEWPHFLTQADRLWLAPLLDQLTEAPAAQPAKV